ncbi:unnamed protein product [Discula destructiva]
MMDILLSIPILSFFFSSTTSLSTSLNLLFFYLTWSTLVLSHGPLKIQLLATLAIRLGVFLLPALLFLLFDILLPSLAVSIKHGDNPSKALPPRNARVLARTLGLALLNILLETALEAGASFGLTTLLGHPPFKTSTTLPLPFAIIKQLGWLYAAREVLAYAIHRALLHSQRPSLPRRLPSFFSLRRGSSSSSSNTTAVTAAVTKKARQTTSYVARVHAHSPAHTRRAPPYALLRAAEHPLPFLLWRFVPLYAPAALAVRPHLLVYLLFAGLVTFEETLAMSGYSVVPGFIMGGIARRTAAHYEAAGRGEEACGNFGAWGMLDWVGGTGLGGRRFEEDVREEGGRRASEAMGAIGDGVDRARKGAKRAKRRAGGSGSSD